MSMPAQSLTIHKTTIPGLLLLELPVHGDSRGWFKENWQREKMVALGLPDFNPVQNNISYNDQVGTTRGIHAEPWDKYVSVASGRIFGAWVDLREGDSFGAVFTAEIGPRSAIFVPRGVGNSYQTLEDNTAYVYLVNDHWTAEAQSEYTFLNLEDSSSAIPWPISLDRAERSEKDLAHPALADVTPMKPKRILVLGANGQLGRALQVVFPDADYAKRDRVDLCNADSLAKVRWSDYHTVINAAAYTNVDEAETTGGRANCWETNVAGVSRLAEYASSNGIVLVHVSSDYVFDGMRECSTEDDPVAPLGVYGQTKAAGDAIVSAVPRHYIVRSSWVVGDGANFVRTMAGLASRGIDPRVVNDQFGRLSFAEDIASAIGHLLLTQPKYGLYNLTNEGPAVSWADIARFVYEDSGHDPNRVHGVSAEEYFAGKPVAERPQNSLLSLDKIKAAGFDPRDARVALKEYLKI